MLDIVTGRNVLSLPFVFAIIVIFLSSCRKDEGKGDQLMGDKSFLVGEWELIGSHHWSKCDGDSGVEYLTAQEQELDYRVVFEERGYVTFFENEKVIASSYILFPKNGFEAKPTGSVIEPKQISFIFYINQEIERPFGGSGMIDSIRTNSLPRTGYLPFPYDECDVFISYLKRK